MDPLTDTRRGSGILTPTEPPAEIPFSKYVLSNYASAVEEASNGTFREWTREATILLARQASSPAQKAEEYHSLMAEFLVTASSYVQQIIDEAALEPNERTLRSILTSGCRLWMCGGVLLQSLNAPLFPITANKTQSVTSMTGYADRKLATEEIQSLRNDLRGLGLLISGGLLGSLFEDQKLSLPLLALLEHRGLVFLAASPWGASVRATSRNRVTAASPERLWLNARVEQLTRAAVQQSSSAAPSLPPQGSSPVIKVSSSTSLARSPSAEIHSATTAVWHYVPPSASVILAPVLSVGSMGELSPPGQFFCNGKANEMLPVDMNWSALSMLCCAVMIPADDSKPKEVIYIDRTKWSEVASERCGVGFELEPIPRTDDVILLPQQHSAKIPNRRASVILNKPILGDALLLLRFKEKTSADAVSHYHSYRVRESLLRHHESYLSATPEQLAALIRQKLIPELAEKLNSKEITVSWSYQLVEKMHERGISARYLGELRLLVTEPRIRRLLLVEMIHRTFKGYLREKLRRHATARSPHTTPAVAIRVYNRLWGNTAECDRFWRTKLREKILRKFPNCFSSNAKGESVDLRSQVNLFQYQVFRNLQHSAGVVFRATVEQRLLRASGFDSPHTFVENEIEKMAVVTHFVKLWNFDSVLAPSEESPFAKSQSLSLLMSRRAHSEATLRVPEASPSSGATPLPTSGQGTSFGSRSMPQKKGSDRRELVDSAKRREEEVDGWVFVEKEAVGGRPPSVSAPSRKQQALPQEEKKDDCVIS